MIQEDLPTWPDPGEVDADYTVPYGILVRLGKGDAHAGRRLLRTLIDIEMTHTPAEGPTERPPNVRVATIEDEESLVDLLKIDVAENAAHVAPMDEGALYEFVQAATRDLHNRGPVKPTIGVIGDPGQVQGAIFLEINRWFWAKDTFFIEERLTAVRPEYRTSRHASDLLKYAKWFVDAMSAQAGMRVYLVASVVATKDINRKIALFGRVLNRVGALYIYPQP